MALVRARDLVIDFPVYEADSRSFKSVIRAATGGILSRDASAHMVVRALDRLNFEFHEGDRVGLIGHNGSGKSTLLRVIAGVYEPIAGSIQVVGRVASMLDVWLGMNSDASGLENIYLRATILGLRTHEVDRLVDGICEFTELGDYIHMPLRTYSSGMQMRLAFAISTSVSVDIILMDEWLSAGDAAFTEKAQARLNQMLGQAKVFVVATHDENLIRKSCNKIMRLDHGSMTYFGPVQLGVPAIPVPTAG
jgi:lipopolysaccharide transport system ATP-binding protein